MSELVVERSGYRLELAPDGSVATLVAAEGRLTLRLPAAFDTLAGPDETIALEPPHSFGDGRFELERRSTRWGRASTLVTCGEETVDVVARVAGSGRPTDVHLLGSRSARGYHPSGSSFGTLFSPGPEDPGRIVRSAREHVALGVVGDGDDGRAHWFFTPPPLCLALTSDESAWTTVSLAAPVSELAFPQLVYEGADRSFSLRLEYEGHTPVDGELAAPAVVVRPGARDPYDGLRLHRQDLEARGAAPPVVERDVPAWWREPIFCGWGAQCALAAQSGRPAPELATQANYDAFLARLEREGVVPGTVVIDDKWQDAYGTNRPDASKWPDLKGWIAARHGRRQRVLLWWKAWDVERLAPELCIRDDAGTPVAFDPTSPEARAVLEESVAAMLGPNGLDADGFKVDFTARTPSGASVSTRGEQWGIALLHDLLAVLHAAAKRVKPDALVITHTPHPAFVDVADMIRLNDMLRLNDPKPWPRVVPQMRYRSDVVRAACPELLIDTDDWCAPDLEQWREYLEVKSSFGVPALYYAQSLDATGEHLEARDYAALRETWERWRATRR